MKNRLKDIIAASDDDKKQFVVNILSENNGDGLDSKISSEMIETIKLRGNDVINELMALFEYMATFDVENALKYMMILYKFADESYMHNICDAIDIWVYERHSPKTISYINEATNANKHHYKRWRDMLKK